MSGFSKCARNAGIIFAASCIVVFELFAGGIVRLFIGDAATIDMGKDFLRILCVAVPLMIINIQTGYTFQAMGMGKQSFLLSALRQGLVHIPLLFVMNWIFGLYGIVCTQLVSDSITCVFSITLYSKTVKRLSNKIALDNK
jgi:Na+-driven multidrug efflux pump